MTPAAPGRSSIFDGFEVIVDSEIRVDASRMGNLLVLREGQTHENAVEQLIRLFPDAHVDDVTHVVRSAMPHAPSLDNLAIQIGASTPRWVTGSTEATAAPMSKKRMRTIGCAVTALVLGVTVGVYVALDRANASPFETTGFLEAADAVNFRCKLQSDMVAECRNLASGVDWEVHASVGANPTDPTVFRFWHGSDLGTLFIFKSVQDRERFPRMSAYSKLYPYITSHDRFTIASTDAVIARNIAAVVTATMIGDGRQLPVLQPKTVSPADLLDEWPTMPPVPQMSPSPAGQDRHEPAGRPQAAVETQGRAAVATSAAGARTGARSAPGGTRGAYADATGTPRPQATTATQPAAQEQPKRTTTPAKPTATPTGETGLSVTIRLPVITFGL